MSIGWWVVVGVVGWIVLSVPVAILAGRWLRRVSADYPEPPPAPQRGGWDDRGPCIEPEPERPRRSST